MVKWLNKGVRGLVWIGFEGKSQPIQNKNHVRFSLDDYSKKIRFDPNICGLIWIGF